MLNSARLALLVLGLLASPMAFSQNSLTVTLDSSGAPLEGVAIFFYGSSEDYPRCFECRTGNNAIRLPDDFESVQYTDAAGQVNFSLANALVGDSVFWASRDCDGLTQMGSLYNPGTSNLTGSLSMACRPSFCAVEGRAVEHPQSGMLTYEAYAYLKASVANVPAGTVNWSYRYRSVVNPAQQTITGNSFSDDFDTIRIPRMPASLQLSRNNFQCNLPYPSWRSNYDSIAVLDLGAWSPNGAPFCTAMFSPSNTGSGGSVGSLVLLEQSTVSRGNIVSWSWFFDAWNQFSATYNTRLPTHTYLQQMPGNYRIILTIMAIDGNDTSYSQHSDIVSFDASGNGSFKQNTPFTVQVVDGGVGLDESELKSLKVFPNPANENVKLKWDDEIEILEVHLIGLGGEIVQSLQPYRSEVYIENLKPGVYHIYVKSKNATKTIKLLVQ